MDENKKKMLQNIEIIGLSILIIVLLSLLIYMVFIKKEDNEGINNNNSEVSFDYNKIEKDLTSELNNKTIYLESCDCSEVLDYDSVDKAKCSKKIISNDTISTFINKLKTADKIELISTSKVCSEYTYSVFTNDTNERLLIAYVADDTSILLVGIRDNGYALHFVGENVNEFLSSLNNDTQQSNNYVFTKLEKKELDSDKNFIKYVTNYFTMIPSVLGQCGEVFSEAIDAKGNTIKVNMNNYEIYNIQIENGKLIATGEPNCACDSDYKECKPSTKVELVYDGNTIEIKEVK